MATGNRITSWACTIEVGAPRSSIFGPFLFNLEVNDLPMSSEEEKNQFFAYDTNILYQEKPESEIHETLEHITAQLF